MSAEVHVCVSCAASGLTCCQFSQVFVSRGDIERIAAVVGNRDFFEFLPADPEDIDPENDPVWARIFDSQYRRRVLRHQHANGGGDCMFLGNTGCVLKENERPMVCRLYPFEYNEKTIKGVTPHHCPEPRRDNHALMLALLGMNRDLAEEWRKTLYQEILEEFPAP